MSTRRPGGAPERTSRSASATPRGVDLYSAIALALVWVAPVLVLPGVFHRWGWPTLLAGIAAVLFALCATPTGRLPRWFVLALSATGVIFVVASLLSADPWGALLGRAPRYEGLVVVPVLVAAIWIAARLLGPRAHAHAFRVTTISVAVAALALGSVALLEALGLRPIDTDLTRPGSLAGNATDQGILGAVLTGILIHMLIGAWHRTRVVEWWALAGAIAGAVAVVTSASRAAFMAAAIIGLVVSVRAVVGSKKQVRAAAVAGLAFVAVALVALAVPDVRARLLGLDSLAAKTIGDRFTIWGDALQLIAAHPWGGIGPSGYMDAVTTVYGDEWYRNVTPDHVLDSPHNVVLQIALAGGVPLVLAGIALGIAVLVAGVRSVRGGARGARRDLLLGALTVIPAAGVALLTTVTSPKTLLPLAVLGGALVARDAVVLIGRGWRWVLSALVLAWAAIMTTWTIADAHLLTGARAALSGRFIEADEAFTAASALRPWDADVPLMATRALGGAVGRGMVGASDIAAEWADRLAVRLPASSAAQEAAGMVALERAAPGDFEVAVARLEAAAALSPANPRIAHELGLAAFAAGDDERARAALTRAVELAPDSEESRAALAEVCRRAGGC